MPIDPPDRDRRTFVDGPEAWSRRRFLGVGAGVVATGLVAPTVLAEGTRLILPPGKPRSRVVRIRSDAILNVKEVHPVLLREMLAATLIGVTEKQTEKEAWRALLRPDDVVGLKFNQSGQEMIGTAPAMATAIITSLKEAGWPPQRIVCFEVPDDVCARLGTRPASRAFDDDETDFESGADQFLSELDKITAIINVPFLKTHNLAVMTGAMKNLSHGLIKHPARYHANGCSPYITDIVALPAIRDKLRLHVMDALRVVFEGGPLASAGNIEPAGYLMASKDPVALDAMGLFVLNDIRRERELPPVAESPSDVPFLATSHQRELGIAVRHGIDVLDQRLP